MEPSLDGLPLNLDDLLHARAIESNRLEFKATWDEHTKTAVVRTLCAFANDLLNLGGGYVVLGVEERGGRPALPPRGLEGIDLDRLQREIRGACERLQPAYQPLVFPVQAGDRPLLVLWAPGGDNRPYQAPEDCQTKGSPYFYYVRRGSETLQARGNTLRQLLEVAAKIPFDDRRNLSARLEDLSSTLVRRFLHDVGSDLTAHSPPLEDLELYRRMNLLVRVNGHEVPRNGALLFFHEDPERFFRGARTEVVHFAEGTGGDVLEERTFRGPLTAQIRETLTYLNGRVGTLVVKVPGQAAAERIAAYPFGALEEALVNAFHHRSYEDPPEPIKVYLYPDRLEITSYPGPVPGLREEHFAAGSSLPSVPARNRRIGDFLRELDLAEMRGTGIPKIQRLLREAGTPAARFDFDEERTYFRVTLLIHPQYQALRGAPEPGARPLKNVVGPPVRRDDFFPREAELEELWHWVERGHVLLTAPRRAGKTSLLLHMQETPRDGWRVLYFSVEALRTEEQFADRLLVEIGRLVPSEALPRPGSGEWRDRAAVALGVLSGLPGRTLLLIEEISIFVRGLVEPGAEERARHFLSWFREIRQTGRVHFVLAGAWGLDRLARALGFSGAINDLAMFRLGPLSARQADELLERLALGEELALPQAVRQRVLAYVIDWPIPYHLQLLFGEILSRVRFRDQPLSEALVDEAYQALLSPANRSQFEHWAEGLNDPLWSADERTLARAVLLAAARDPQGVSRASILQLRRKIAPGVEPSALLSDLADASYLARFGDRWRFASALLRDWWLKWQSPIRP